MVSILEITCICLLTIMVAPVLPVFLYFPLMNVLLLSKIFVDALNDRGVRLLDIRYFELI